MNALITWGVVFLVLLLIALIRIGVRARYSDDGFLLQVKFLLFRITLFPKEKKDGSEKKQKKKPKEEKTKEKKGGSVDFVLDLLEAAKRVLTRLKKRIRMDDLTVHYVSGSDDPCDAAINYGAASAGAGVIIEFLKHNFKLRKYDVTTDVDFSGDGDKIYLDAGLSLAIWEIVYIALGLTVLLKHSGKSGKNHLKTDKNDRSADRKVDNNGKTPLK